MTNTKTMHFVGGLPRTGATFICNLLRQNPDVHGEPLSPLCSTFDNIRFNWEKAAANTEVDNSVARDNMLRSMFDGYYAARDKKIVFDKDLMWVKNIGPLEDLFQRKVKLLCLVRNPAEILASFEKLRNKAGMKVTVTDEALRENSTIASRAYYYAGPQGMLGMSHAAVKDAITMGYQDRLLFVDYNRFCNSPKAQMKRIYDFFELPSFTHDFNNITQEEKYNDLATKLPGVHKIKPKVERTTVNCVQHLGLDLYQQYNSQIFWDAWI